ncbi:hypothetical protein CCR75_004210 [Bremia lactucae]|uniref:40S ribosomal protein S29 n=3 Tax=Peronosporaceae TaxID=4777 RepID=A0A976FJU0_BRELC|nr:hypothetical protein CCR75_004210 [Bremia lactucae]
MAIVEDYGFDTLHAVNAKIDLRVVLTDIESVRAAVDANPKHTLRAPLLRSKTKIIRTDATIIVYRWQFATMANLTYSHPRTYGKDSRHCRVCKTTRGLIRKYHLNMCRRCFRERATDIGFVKYR